MQKPPDPTASSQFKSMSLLNAQTPPDPTVSSQSKSVSLLNDTKPTRPLGANLSPKNSNERDIGEA